MSWAGFRLVGPEDVFSSGILLFRAPYRDYEEGMYPTIKFRGLAYAVDARYDHWRVASFGGEWVWASRVERWLVIFLGKLLFVGNAYRVWPFNARQVVFGVADQDGFIRVSVIVVDSACDNYGVGGIFGLHVMVCGVLGHVVILFRVYRAGEAVVVFSFGWLRSGPTSAVLYGSVASCAYVV